MDSLYFIDTLSIYQNGSGYISIDLKIARSSRFSFISATPTHNNKKQAKQLEALLALEFLFTNELGKPTQRFDSYFVEPVLLLPARRAHSRPGALRGFCFWNRRQCFADALNQVLRHAMFSPPLLVG